jgi:RNA polymerase sigma-70 factor (ECF subfamily)
VTPANTASVAEGAEVPDAVRGWLRSVSPDSPSRPTPAPEDLALMRRVARRDAVSEQQLVERVLPRVRRRAWALTRRREDADDATQAAMLEILRSAATFNGSGTLEGWCERIAVRTTLRLQRRGQQRAAVIDAAVAPDAIEQHEVVEPMHERIAGEVTEYLEALSDERRQAIVLRHVLDYSIDEIAEATGVSRNTVKDRLRCALEQLRKLIHRADVIALGRTRK